jgi:hypothetical protein
VRGRFRKGISGFYRMVRKYCHTVGLLVREEVPLVLLARIGVSLKISAHSSLPMAE